MLIMIKGIVLSYVDIYYAVFLIEELVTLEKASHMLAVLTGM